MNDTGLRNHLGLGRLALKPELSVFINCPFDPRYRHLFDALIFSTICCGFIPRSAIESGTSSVPRMNRIAEAIQTSKYSIHDLSRCRGEGECNLARFNMPLELGMAMTERYRENGSNRHDWLVLVPKGHVYKSFVSDLCGFDPGEHDESIESIVPVVMSWLATRPDAVRVPTPHAVLNCLPVFIEARSKLSDQWRGCEPWADLLMEGLQIGTTARLIP